MKPRVCAVSYLNTSPLVWGMLHGAERGLFDLEFRIPAECADRVAAGEADIGIIPSFELSRQKLAIVEGAGIACHGPVRSILLVSSTPLDEVRTLAADSSSRTSVELARVILARRYGSHPEIFPHAPDLPAMMRAAGAALVIGDPALAIDPAALPWHVYDLGAEWVEMTGLPMVFAVWAGRAEFVTPELEAAFRRSCRYGREHIPEIARVEGPPRGIAPERAREYLAHNIVHELGEHEYAGLRLFLEYATGGQASNRTQARPR